MTSTKARLHNRKCSKSSRKNEQKKAYRLIAVEERNSKPKGSIKATVLRNKNKKNQENNNSLMSNCNARPKLSHNPDAINSSPSVTICSVRKLISPYTIPPYDLCKNTKVSQRPKTSVEKYAHETSELEIKSQSCSPPLFQTCKTTPTGSVKLKKVYYSEAHSHMLAGIPCVPPVSPVNSKQLILPI